MANLTIDDSIDDDEGGITVKLDAPAHTVEHDFEDPFNSTWDNIRKAEGLGANFRRKVDRMQKSFTGQGDAKSKKLDPLDLTGYSLFQIVQPPYNVLYLAQLYDVSPYHHSAVNAKSANVIGLGYKFENTWATTLKI